MTRESSLRVAIMFTALVLSAAGVAAPAQRTFVSTTGSDLNHCTVSAPCRSFNAALAQTNPGGEVVAVDSGGYGPVTIDKNVLLTAAPGAHAAMSVSTGAGVTIDLVDRVILRHLTIVGLGGSLGIFIQSAGQIFIENCSISGFGYGIHYGNGSNSYGGNVLSIRDTWIGHSYVGLNIQPQGALPLTVTLDDSYVVSNQIGVQISGSGFVRSTFFHTFFLNNTSWALSQSKSVGTSALTTIESSVLTGNTGGIQSNGDGGPSYVRVSNSTIVGQHGTALSAINGGLLLTRLNNTVEDNVASGAFTGTYSAK
jgi:hypothetical protein